MAVESTERSLSEALRILTLITFVALVGCRPQSLAVPSSTELPPKVVNHSHDSVLVTASQRTAIRFEERATAAGIEFAYRNGEEAGKLAILESLGGGVGLIDYDQDGDIDLFFPGGGNFTEGGQVGGRPGSLFRQIAPWQFSVVTESAGVGSDVHYTHGAAVADSDNDGFPDIIATSYDGLLYFHNNGDGTFTEAAVASGLDDRLWSSSAAWGDLNGDGVLDLYVTHYVDWSPDNNPHCVSYDGRPDVCPPNKFSPLPDALYFSQGDGTFRNGSREAGLLPLGKGLGVLIADVDLDGHQDIYVANDTVPNFLYRNLGDGRLDDISNASGTAVNDRGLPDGSMGIDVGDYNLDGLPDIWVANYERESFALYRNCGNSLFHHVSQATGVTAVGAQHVGWGTVFFDADADGDEDIFVSCGHVVHFPEIAPVRQTPLLFENLEGKRFENIAARAGNFLSSPHAGRGCAAGDLDLDGDLDLVVSAVNEPIALLANETLSSHHWLEIRLIGVVSNRDASGAIVTIRTDAGSQIRQVKGGASYASTGDACLHFGLGTAERVIEVEITWPAGGTQRVSDIAIDRRHIMHEPVNLTANES